MYHDSEENRFPNRKCPRLREFDYRSRNYYFITVCTYEKKCIFGEPAQLNRFGKIAESAILSIPIHFSGIRVDKYVVMPNHVHMILINEKDGCDIFSAIGSFKGYVTRKIHESDPENIIWQKSYHDHVIRNQESYEKIWSYIETNPLRWEKDCFYQE